MEDLGKSPAPVQAPEAARLPAHDGADTLGELIARQIERANEMTRAARRRPPPGAAGPAGATDRLIIVALDPATAAKTLAPSAPAAHRKRTWCCRWR